MSGEQAIDLRFHVSEHIWGLGYQQSEAKLE